MSYRTEPPFEPTRADRWLVALVLFVVLGCLAYALLDGAGVV